MILHWPLLCSEKLSLMTTFQCCHCFDNLFVCWEGNHTNSCICICMVRHSQKIDLRGESSLRSDFWNTAYYWKAPFGVTSATTVIWVLKSHGFTELQYGVFRIFNVAAIVLPQNCDRSEVSVHAPTTCFLQNTFGENRVLSRCRISLWILLIWYLKFYFFRDDCETTSTRRQTKELST